MSALIKFTCRYCFEDVEREAAKCTGVACSRECASKLKIQERKWRKPKTDQVQPALTGGDK